MLFVGCWFLIAQLRQILPILSETTSPFFPTFMLWCLIAALSLTPTFLSGGSPDLRISGALFPAPLDHRSDVPVLEKDALATTTWETGAELTESQRDTLLVDGASLPSLEERDRERARTRRSDEKVARRDRIRAWAEQELALDQQVDRGTDCRERCMPVNGQCAATAPDPRAWPRHAEATPAPPGGPA